MESQYKEIEARWINLNRADVEQRLQGIGAVKAGEYFFKEWIFKYEHWENKNRRIRVRTDGENHWLTYKANATWEIDSTEEVEVSVSSAEHMVKFLKVSDVPLLRYQEKKRIRYTLDDLTVELDFWPKIPMVLELEGPSKARVVEGAKLLGLAWKDAIFEDQKVVHEKYFNIKLDTIAEYRFEK